MSSNTGTSSTNIIKLNNKNYIAWRFVMESVIENRDLEEVVYQEVSIEDEEKLKKKSKQARELLTTSIEQNIIEQLANCKTASAIWSRLQSIFQRQSECNLEAMINKFWSLRMGETEPMSVYIGRVETLASSIRSSGEELSERSVKAKLIGGLASQYQGFSRAWDATSENDKTLKNLIDRLIKDEDAQRSQRDQSSTSALYAKTRRFNPRERSRKEDNSNPSKKPKRVLDIKKHSTCHNCGKKGHWASQCWNNNSKDRQSKFKGQQQESVTFMARTEDDGESGWYADSGASSHMSGDKALFETFEVFEVPRRIVVGNTAVIEAVGTGNIKFESKLSNDKHINICLTNVLYVPNIAENLLSIGVAAQNGITATFVQDDCILRLNGVEVARGTKSKRNGLYQMDIHPLKSSALLVKNQRTVEEWHKSLCHVNPTRIQEIVKNETADGIEIINSDQKMQCQDCPCGKATHASHPSSSRERATEVGQIVHVDLMGMYEPSLGNNRYVLLLTDEASNYMVPFPIKTKDTVSEKLEEYFSLIESETGKRCRSLWSDCGTEFVRVRALINLEHATLTTSSPYTPQQNGKAERSNRTLREAARTILVSSGLPENLWAEATVTAAYVLNRTALINNTKVTPYEMWTGRKPYLGHIHEFGRPVQVLVEPRKMTKWSSKTKMAHIIGFTNRRNTYKVYLPTEGVTRITSDVIFREHTTQEVPKTTLEKGEEPEKTATIEVSGVAGPQQEESSESASVIDKGPTGLDNQGEVEQPSGDEESIESPEFSPVSVGNRSQVNINCPTNKSSFSRIRLSNPFKERHQTLAQDWTVRKGGISGFLGLMAYKEPESYRDALDSEEGRFWEQAIQEEIKSLEENSTWKIAELPHGRQPLTARWIFKKKLLADGTLDKYKARLVARGYNQRYGIDYFETYASVVRHETIRLFFAICVHKRLEILQFDVTTAFLNGILDEEVYMLPPDGIRCPQDKVLKLVKSIYGLRQAPRCWQAKLTEILRKIGLCPTNADPSLYTGIFKGSQVIMIVYVDDGIAASEDAQILREIISLIARELKVKIVDSSCFVGFEIVRSDKATIMLHQTNYIQKMLINFNMANCTKTSAPMSDVTRLFTDSEDDKASSAPYRELVGALNYASCLTRPDITYATSVLSRFNNAPKDKHWSAAKRVLRYLKGTMNLGLVFRGEQEFNIKCFSDADWAGDVESRKSTSGILLEACDAPIIFKSKQQSTIALSTTESEYIAASLASREISWTKGLLQELGVKADSVLYMDNQAAIRLVKTKEFRARTKHIDIKYHFIQEKFEQNLFKLEYVHTSNQKADILTKALPPIKHTNMLNQLSMSDTAKKTLVALLGMIMLCETFSHSNLQHEDPLIWLKTSASYADGQIDMALSLGFHDPCNALFSNLTGVPGIDKTLVNTCSKRFQSEIVESLNDIATSGGRKVREGGTIAAILALSALWYSTYSSVKTQSKIARGEQARLEMIRLLDEKVSKLYEKVDITTDRIARRISNIERDIDLLGSTLTAQPMIQDALFHTLVRMHEEKKRIQQLKKELRINGEVPGVLLEMFNITELANPATLRHSKVISYSGSGDELDVRISILKLSQHMVVMKADAFHYQAIENRQICEFRYEGPEYVLVNRTSNCVRPLYSGEILDDIVIGKGCVKRETVDYLKLFAPHNCRKLIKSNISRPLIQFKHDGNRLRINCQGHSLMLNNTKVGCPNYVFSVGDDTTFEIDDFVYKHEKSAINKSVEYELPTHINMHLGLPRKEFRALTAEEIQELEASSKRINFQKVADELTEESEAITIPTFGFMSSGFGTFSNCVAILTALFLIGLFIKSRLYTRPSPAAICAAIISLGPMMAVGEKYDHKITIAPTADVTTKEIAALQKKMIESRCNYWSLSEDYEKWMHHEGHYAVATACGLAGLKIVCPCDSSPEFIPVVRHNKIRVLDELSNSECPGRDEVSTYAEQLDFFDTTAEYLCQQSPIDPWSRQYYGQLIASACILSKKAFNCFCHGPLPHKNIFRDALTIGLTQANLTSRISECTLSNQRKFQERKSDSSTLYAKLYDRNRYE